MLLGDIVHTSTLDWPGKVSLVVFLGGCNLRCPYCSNHRYWDAKNCQQVSASRVLNEIDRVRPLLDAVVFSGGEPYMQTVALQSLSEEIRDMGLKIGVHTNGFYPESLRDVDAVMLDIKAPLDPLLYERACGKAVDLFLLRESIDRVREMKKSGLVEYWEARTVVFRGMNDTPDEVIKCYEAVRDCDRYYLSRGSGAISYQQMEEVPGQQIKELARSIGAPNVYTR